MHPLDDTANPMQGVFNTRSADRPNPIGLHEVEIASIEGRRVRVLNLEAVDGTPVIRREARDLVLRPGNTANAFGWLDDREEQRP